MNKKQLLLFLIPFIAIAGAFASMETSFNLHLQAFDITNQSASAVDMDLNIFGTSTCSGTPLFIGTCNTDVNGVCDIPVTMNTSFNTIYYACVYANSSLVSGSPSPFRAGQGQVSEEDVYFTDLNITNELNVNGDVYADYFYGDGSGLTNLNVSGSFNESDPLWTANESSVARIGSCLYGQFVENATTGGVDCAGIKDFGLYYVSQSGDDINGDGSLNNPYQTYQAVLDNASEPMVNIMILDPENIADQNLTIYDYRGVSLFLPVGLAPYHAGEIDNLVMGNDSSFVGHSIFIKESITCGATSWSDIYMDNGGFVNELTITNPTNCIFWFAGTQMKPNTWNLIKSNGADYNGDVSVRGVFAVSKGYGLFGNDNINFNYNGADKTLFYNTTSNQFEFNDDISAPYFIGDGSQLTNITADDLDINDNEWLYLNTNDTIGLRYNSSGTGNIEMNHRLYVPNMISANSIDASLGYFDYLQMGYKGYSTGNPFTVINTTGTQKLKIDFSGDITFLDPLENNYIIWNESSVGEWNYGTYKGLELYAGTNGIIYLYNPTEVTGNLTVTGNVSADYFIGDGSQLTNLPISAQYWNRSGTTLITATAGDDVSIGGDIYLNSTGKKIYLDNNLDKWIWANNVTSNIEIDPNGNEVWFMSNAITSGAFLSNQTGVGYMARPDTAYIFDFPTNVRSLLWNTTTSLFEFNGNLKLNNTLWLDGQNLTWDSANNKFLFSNNVSAPNVNAFATSVNGVGTFNYTMLNGLNSTIGNSTGNTTITPTGTTLYGTARVNKTIQNYAFNLYGKLGTYNGQTYIASTLASLDATLFQSLPATAGAGDVGGAFVYNFIMPQDRVTGSNFTVVVHYADGTTETCNQVMGVGKGHNADGESYSQTETWNEQTFAVPTTQFLKATREFTFDGSAIENGNSIAITVYRYGEAVADTCNGAIIVSSLEVRYLSDKI